MSVNPASVVQRAPICGARKYFTGDTNVYIEYREPIDKFGGRNRPGDQERWIGVQQCQGAAALVS